VARRLFSRSAPVARAAANAAGLRIFFGLLLFLLLLAFACSVDFPRTALGFKGDEATYYSLAHSLARDGDFAFERKDLARVWEEFAGGPEGIFLKRGKKATGSKSRDKHVSRAPVAR
jgi:hypothetical protein